MKNLIFILCQVTALVSFAAEKPYESYDEIVRTLSAQRSQQLATKMSVSLPAESKHLSIGFTNTSTNVGYLNTGNVSHQGLLLGAAFPLISAQLFIEGYGKFFHDTEVGQVSASLQQYELRLSHREPVGWALLNMAVGTSVRNMTVQAPGFEQDFRTPNLLVGVGLERRITPRISMAGDLSYHRSMREESTNKNTLEFTLRLNYHL